MEEHTKIIRSKNFETTFRLTDDKDEWCAKISKFGGLDNIELSINLENYFNESSWAKFPDFIEYLNENLSLYIEKAIDVLPEFAKMTGYFSTETTETLNFGFGNFIIYKDNSFTLADRWEFELDFSTNSKEGSIENIDGYGRWLVTFNGNCIGGIRRETW
jgi:hypothetical protein